MGFFVRKVSRAKWPDGENIKFESVLKLNADAITCDLKTENNEFSWWRIDEFSELEDMAISIASVFQSKAPIFVVFFPEEEMKKTLLDIENTPNNGYTAVVDQKKNHYDIQHLNVAGILAVAELVANSIQEKKVLKVPRTKIVSKIKEWISIDAVDKTLLGKAYGELIESK